MANIAQTVNVLQAMVLTQGDALVLTPTYHVFKMYVPFQDATSLPVSYDELPDYALDQYRVPSLSTNPWIVCPSADFRTRAITDLRFNGETSRSTNCVAVSVSSPLPPTARTVR